MPATMQNQKASGSSSREMLCPSDDAPPRTMARPVMSSTPQAITIGKIPMPRSTSGFGFAEGSPERLNVVDLRPTAFSPDTCQSGVERDARGGGGGTAMGGGKETFTAGVHTHPMSFKKPFRAVPIQLGERYQVQRRLEQRSMRMANVRFTALAGILSAATFGFVWFLPERSSGVVATQQSGQPAATVYYAGCDEARAAGAAPILKGQPGYRPEMDGDADGIACEPHRRW